MPTEKHLFSVLTVSGTAKGAELVEHILPVSEFCPIVRAKSADEAKRILIERQFDLIIINTPLTDEFGSEFALDTAQNVSSGILLLVKSDYYDQISGKVENYGILTVTKPLSSLSLYQSAKLLVAAGQRIRLLEKKNKSLQDKMEEIRLINRAKCLLIECLNFNEPQAHHYIERHAMDNRMTKLEVAEEIIKIYGN